jgi:multiple sugar transport system substrate-binding protein
MQKNALMKWALRAVTLCIAVGLLAGCGSSKKAQEGKSSSSGETTLTVWGWNPGDMEKIFSEFSKTNPGYKLNYVTVQQAEAFQKLQTTVSAGLDLPDLVPSEIGQRGTMMKLDIWENLEAAPYKFDKKLVFPYLYPLITNEKGIVVCTPWDISSAALAYRRPLAKKYLGTDDDKKLQAMFPTWDSMLAKGKDIYKNSGHKVFLFASLNDVRIIADGQNPNPIVKDQKLDLSGSVEPTLELMIKFRDNHLAGNISSTSPAYNASYASDKYIFYPAAAWSPNYVIEPNDPKGDGKWGLMIPPGGAFNWGGSAFMIPKNAKNKLAAFKLANWLVTKEGTVAQRNLLGYNISNVEAYDDAKFRAFTSKNFGSQNLGEIYFGDALKVLTPRPVSPYDVLISDVWSLVTEALNSDPNLKLDKALQLFETEFRNKAPEVK